MTRFLMGLVVGSIATAAGVYLLALRELATIETPPTYSSVTSRAFWWGDPDATTTVVT